MAISISLGSRTVWYILLTIVLGAVGSGIWEWILKPMLGGFTDLGLYIATLGLTKFKDALYQEIALGFREEASLELYMFIFAAVPSFGLGIILGIVLKLLLPASDPQSSKQGTLLRTIADTRFMILGIFLAFLFAFSVVQATQVSYVQRAVTHFHQLLAIAAPNLKEEERVVYRSRFAEVSSRADYERLVTSLREICRTNGRRIPEFSIW